MRFAWWTARPRACSCRRAIRSRPNHPCGWRNCGTSRGSIPRPNGGLASSELSRTRYGTAVWSRYAVVSVRKKRRANVQIAAGETWALASEAIAAPYRTTPTAIVYRPFDEPPIPCWIALVWRPNAPRLVHHLVDVARTLGGAMEDASGA